MKDKLRKQNRFRHLIQAGFTALTNGYIRGFAEGRIYKGGLKAYCVPGLNCYSCPGALGSCPIGSLQAVLDSGKFRFSAYVFGTIMAFGVLFGRLVCGFLCPFGFVQDLLYKIPCPGKRKNLPGHRYLRYLKYLILLVFVILLPMLVVDVVGMGQPWFCEYICPSGTLLGGIPLILSNPLLQSAIGPRFVWKLTVLVICLLTAVFVYRPFCKYLCPLGAIYGCMNPVSFYRMRVDTEACIECGACKAACGMDISVWKSPNSVECIRCGNCRAACPEQVIHTTLEDGRVRLGIEKKHK